MLLPFYQQEEFLEVGCDEAGRGCLAGPVFAAAVILHRDFSHPLLTDSKQLSEKERRKLRHEIEACAVAYAVASVDHQEIDQINILNASFLAMHKALAQLQQKPGFIIVDGNRFKPYQDIKHQCVVKGDGKYYSIAAASILAKTYRDEYMENLHENFPHYDWKQNKGYPTSKHREAVMTYGLSPYHRKTFKITHPQLSIFSNLPYENTTAHQ